MDSGGGSSQTSPENVPSTAEEVQASFPSHFQHAHRTHVVRWSWEWPDSEAEDLHPQPEELYRALDIVRWQSGGGCSSRGKQGESGSSAHARGTSRRRVWEDIDRVDDPEFPGSLRLVCGTLLDAVAEERVWFELKRPSSKAVQPSGYAGIDRP